MIDLHIHKNKCYIFTFTKASVSSKEVISHKPQLIQTFVFKVYMYAQLHVNTDMNLFIDGFTLESHKLVMCTFHVSPLCRLVHGLSTGVG